MTATRTWLMGLVAVLLALAAWKVCRAGRRAEPVRAPRDDQADRPEPADRPDPVDEAIAESFPASDPPSWAGQ